MQKAPDDGREYETVIFEDFEKFTAGSEELPDTRAIEDARGWIPDEYTITPGWSGVGIKQAGGLCLIDKVDYQPDPEGEVYKVPGYLVTPAKDLGLDGGKTYLSFRARSIEPDGGYLVISWTYPYEEGGSVTWGMYDQWGLYENIELDCCTEDCEIQIYSTSCSVLIDNIKVEKFKPELYPPVSRKWTDYDDSGQYTKFTGHWDPVEGATAYEFHVFRYYDDGISTKKVVKQLNVTDTFYEVTDKHKLDPSYTYYYYVTAKNDNGFVSEASPIVQVFDVMQPSGIWYDDVDVTGYTVGWDHVRNADGYGFFSFLTHKAINAEDYTVMKEDFSSIPSKATPDNPDVSVIGSDSLDDFGISRANWTLWEGAYIEGAVGMHVYTLSNGDHYYGELDSPIMVLAGSSRELTVSADYMSLKGVKPVVMLACPVTNAETGKTDWQFVDQVTIGDISSDWTNHTVTLKATSSLCKLAISTDDVSGDFFFLDNLHLTQHLEQGEYVSLPYTYTEIKDGTTAYRDKTLDHTYGDAHSFSLFAARKVPGSSWFTRYVTSEPTEYVDVPPVVDSLRSHIAPSSWNLQGGILTATDKSVGVYTAEGLLLQTLQPGQSARLPKGILILNCGGQSAKIINK